MQDAETERRDGIDLTDPASFASGFPHDDFQRLRAEAPVCLHPRTPRVTDSFWVVAGHADCVVAAADPRLRPAHRGGRAAFDAMDAERHDGLRNLLTPALSPAAMRGIEDDVRLTAEQLVAAASKRGGCDVVHDVAAVLSFHTMARVLGVAERDRPALAELVFLAIDGGTDTDAAREAIERFGHGLVADKRAHPGADILSKAIHAPIRRRDTGEHDHLDQAEVVGLYDLFIAGGIDTTRDAISSGVLALAENPDQWRSLRADRSQLRHATEEILRWSTPTPCDWRVATVDLELSGQLISARQRVTLWWASANRDEAVFPDAPGFDVGRDPNPQVAFGSGQRACLGAALARLQIRLLLDVLVDHVARFEVAAQPEWTCTSERTSLASLPIAITTQHSPSHHNRG
ncbi:MAG: cytochrome P450 [Acidimicrobiales bacterium]